MPRPETSRPQPGCDQDDLRAYTLPVMLRGLLKLTWIEIKVFMREPLGAFGTIFVPVLTFIIVGRLAGRTLATRSPSMIDFVRVGVPVFASILISLSAVLSLVTIISIYREGGILKRLRATPMRPHTILTAHVVVKLLFDLATLLALIAAGKRVFTDPLNAPLLSFSVD